MKMDHVWDIVAMSHQSAFFYMSLTLGLPAYLKTKKSRTHTHDVHDVLHDRAILEEVFIEGVNDNKDQKIISGKVL